MGMAPDYCILLLFEAVMLYSCFHPCTLYLAILRRSSLRADTLWIFHSGLVQKTKAYYSINKVKTLLRNFIHVL